MRFQLIISVVATFYLCHDCYSQCAYNGEATSQGITYTQSGNSSLDLIVYQELDFLSSKFGIRPKFYFLKEFGGANSWASPYSSDFNFPNGTVMLGLGHIAQICSESFSGTCSAVPVVMAHEFGHIIQYIYNPQLSKGKKAELFADYIAGVYLYYRITEFRSLELIEAANFTFKSGDNNFNSPAHHGTSYQRLAALKEGYRVASIYPLNMQRLVTLASLYVNEQ